jgi:hypothetical protein
MRDHGGGIRVWWTISWYALGGEHRAQGFADVAFSNHSGGVKIFCIGAKSFRCGPQRP